MSRFIGCGISLPSVIFPLAGPPPRLVVDGTVVRSYVSAYVHRGRILAPVDPFVTRLATRIEYSGRNMVVVRGNRSIVVRLRAIRHPSQLQSTFVEIAPLLRALGEIVHYDARSRVLEVHSPALAIVTPTPFDPGAPEAPPEAIFTPVPVPTPRPVFTGRPLPRRTPLPAARPSGGPYAKVSRPAAFASSDSARQARSRRQAATREYWAAKAREFRRSTRPANIPQTQRR